jgi:hypothetical protein
MAFVWVVALKNKTVSIMVMAIIIITMVDHLGKKQSSGGSISALLTPGLKNYELKSVCFGFSCIGHSEAENHGHCYFVDVAVVLL